MARQLLAMDQQNIPAADAMTLTKLLAAILFTAALGMAAPAGAAPVQTTGSGSAVAQADFTADFSFLFDGASSGYFEGGLAFAAGGGDEDEIRCATTLCAHGGFANMSGGIYYNVGQYAEVKGVNDEVFSGFETVVGTGFWVPGIHGIWETWLDDVRTGSGTFDTVAGEVIGLYDKRGFDMIRIGTNGPWSSASAFDGSGATAIDDVRMQLRVEEVPEPGAMLLIGLGLVALALVRRRFRARK
jgi:hypothetical protein